MKYIFIMLNVLLGFPGMVFAAETQQGLVLTNHWVGITAVIVFVIAYAFVMAEEYTHLRKSKPVLLAAGIIWVLIAGIYSVNGFTHEAEKAIRHNLLEYSELMLFLLVAMTYINTMQERNVFDSLRSWLIRMGFGFRSLFWITGVLAFLMSPVADNLTTALLMCAVVMAVGGDNSRFVLLACINIVVAANAGGAFSPFGDITTLMVWQKEIETPQGTVDFAAFFVLFLPALINWLVPAVVMVFAVPQDKPDVGGDMVEMKRGAKRIIALFLVTIITAVSFHNYLYLPPVIGMMVGLAYLGFFGFYLKKTCPKHRMITLDDVDKEMEHEDQIGDIVAYDVFNKVARAEWDTLLFFYGVMLCVGGLGFIGYLAMVSEIMYVNWGATYANIAVGIVSAIIDNIPVMFAVLTMMPDMSMGQWMLVTLTAGVGGSLLSIGSAAGVAMMGQTRGKYTFFGHLKWTPVIALGYASGIISHMYLNQRLF